MQLYQIKFENNKAISASLLPLSQGKSVEIEHHSDKRSIKWITVFARNEQEGIKIANEVVEGVINLL